MTKKGPRTTTGGDQPLTVTPADIFKARTTLSAERKANLFSSATIILDTNVLLHHYRCSRDTHHEVISTLNRFRERLWIPHNVASEFFSNRIEVVTSQPKAIRDIIKAAEVLSKTILENSRRHLSAAFLSILTSLERRLTADRAKLNKLLDDPLPVGDNDWVIQDLYTLFCDRVGPPYADTDITKIYAEGRRRYDALIPPGFEDRKKPEPECFGDWVLWCQILDRVRGTAQDAIFVTDDNKDDWWLRVDGRVAGPRPELRNEYAVASEGGDFWMYTSSEFLKFASQYDDTTLSDSALSEISEIATSYSNPSRPNSARESSSNANVDYTLITRQLGTDLQKSLSTIMGESSALQYKIRIHCATSPMGSIARHIFTEISNRAQQLFARASDLDSATSALVASAQSPHSLNELITVQLSARTLLAELERLEDELTSHYEGLSQERD